MERREGAGWKGGRKQSGKEGGDKLKRRKGAGWKGGNRMERRKGARKENREEEESQKKEGRSRGGGM